MPAWQIGDVVLATPSIELLKRRYPDAEIHLLTEKKCAPLLEHNPHLGKVWALDKKVLSSLPQEIAWYWHVARTGYDLVVDFQQLPRCRWVVAFSGAPVRLSYTPPWYTRLLYTHSSDMLDGYSAMSKASVLRLSASNGTASAARLSSRTRSTPLRAARSGRLAAGTAPHHAGPHAPPATRRWPLAHYAGLVSLLAERDASLYSCLSGGRKRGSRNSGVVPPLPRRFAALAGSDAVATEMARIAEADLHIGNCSAPRHIAVAVDTPTLTVLGSTTPAWTFPSPSTPTLP
ncbi:MAG: glycosyltransferase family 9 protein [Bilophila wadsworthia]